MGNQLWRAELRAEGIERRPPPSADRGHIEQPGERRPEIVRRPPFAALPPISPDPPSRPALPAPKSAEKAPDVIETAGQTLVKVERNVAAAKSRKQRVDLTDSEKEPIILEALRGGHGNLKKTADDWDISPSALSNWIKTYKLTHPDWYQRVHHPETLKTMVSAAPASSVQAAPPPAPAPQVVAPAPPPVLQPAPPPPPVQAPPALSALESYINALVDQRVDTAVKSAMKREFQKVWGSNDT